MFFYILSEHPIIQFTTDIVSFTPSPMLCLRLYT